MTKLALILTLRPEDVTTLNLTLINRPPRVKNKIIEVVRGLNLNLERATSKASALTADQPLLTTACCRASKFDMRHHAETLRLLFTPILQSRKIITADNKLHETLLKCQWSLPVIQFY